MKRESIKYVVLGIGLGFLIAAGLFLKFGGREKEILAEREIVERARSLGMVFLTEGQPTDGSAKASDPVIQPQEPEVKPAEANSAAKSEEEKAAAEQEPATEGKKEDVEEQPDTQAESDSAAEKPAPLTKPQEIAPPKQPAKPKTTPAKPASDVVTEVISGDDPAAKDLLPPPNPNRPKSTETLPTNHF